MILTSYVFKDIVKNQIVVFGVVFAIFMCQSVIKILGQASSGDLPAGVVVEMVWYSMPTFGFLLIPLTLFVGIIMSLARMSSDSEMVVMKSIGISGFDFMKIALIISIFSAIFCGFNCLYFQPEAAAAQKKITDNSQNNPQYLPIESGKFTNLDDYTIYIQQVKNKKKDKDLNQIYIVSSMKTMIESKFETSFLAASGGYLKYDENGDQWLVLDKGQAYRTKGIDPQLKRVKFSTMNIPVNFEETEDQSDIDMRVTPTSDLIKSDDFKAKVELQWRISPIIACFILAMIAVPLSMVNPRQGRFARLGPAMFIFVFYFLILLLIRNILNSGSMWLYPGMYIVPIGFLLFVVIPLNIQKVGVVRKKKSASKAQA